MKQAKKQLDSSAMAEILAETREEMRAQLRVLAQRRVDTPAGGFDRHLAQSAAALGRAITGATAELRQQERHEQRMVDEMTPQERRRVAFQFTKELDIDGRKELRAILDELDGEGRLLG